MKTQIKEKPSTIAGNCIHELDAIMINLRAAGFTGSLLGKGEAFQIALSDGFGFILVK